MNAHKSDENAAVKDNEKKEYELYEAKNIIKRQQINSQI